MDNLKAENQLEKTQPALRSSIQFLIKMRVFWIGFGPAFLLAIKV